MNNRTQSVTQALVESLKSENLQSVSIDMFEAALDTCLEEGVLKDIPILGTILGVGKTAYGFREILFAKKVVHFLVHLAEVSSEDREKFVQGLDAGSRRKVGETVIGALDKIETVEKSDFIGRLFKAYMQEKISLDTFRRLVSKICNCPLPDLLSLESIVRGTEYDDEMIYEDLSNAGFMRNFVIDGGVIDAQGNTHASMPAAKRYEVTEHGSLFVKHALQ